MQLVNSANAITTTEIAVNDFSSNIDGYTSFQGIPDVDNSSLDPLRELVMNFPEIRKIGDEILCVACWTSNSINSNTQVRTEIVWTVLRYNEDGNNVGWSLFQQGRIADSGGVKSFWMPSINIDDNGFMSVLFSGSSNSDPPSLYFTRKRLSDSEFPEPIEITSGIGSVSTTRWGDYFSLVSAEPNMVVGIGTVSSQSSFQTSVYTHKLTFPGIFMEIHSSDTSELNIDLKFTEI